MTAPNRFVVIAPFRNASKTVSRTVLSLAGQSYSNWKFIAIDDASTDGSESILRGMFDALGIGERLTYVKNQFRRWEISNMLSGLALCEDDDIVTRVDCDDYLCDLNALEIMNMAFEQSGADFVWSQQRWFDDNGVTNYNISGPLPPGADPYRHPWVTSHLRCHRKHLLNGVSDENYRGADGEYLKRVGDQAFALPALHNSKKWLYVALPLYAYRCDMSPDTFKSEDAKFQKAEAEFVRSRGYV